MNTLIFTDGACSGNPGPGGWGAIVATPDGNVKELGGSEVSTTNNRMEIQACIFALIYAQSSIGQIDLYTDSTYVIRGITQWIWGWKKNDWKTNEGKDVINQDIWIELSRLVSARGAKNKINWLYSRGHVGTPGNERCDEIAVLFSKKKWVDLYDGPLLQYDIAIHDVPVDTSLPEIKPRTENKKPYSYLSYVGGQVWRHTDWSSCERRTKGQSGAKFKKAMSQAEEVEILKSWGLPTTTLIKS